MASTTLPTALAFVKQRTMRVIAVASHARMPMLPDVPTVAESGFPDFENRSWIAFFAPAMLPDAIAQTLNAEINHALQQTDVRERLTNVALDPQTMSQPEFAAYVRQEVAKWAQVIKATGITPN
jgi:tripartite-type tricarboxylate transporter receptor subunit TctC